MMVVIRQRITVLAIVKKTVLIGVISHTRLSGTVDREATYGLELAWHVVPIACQG